MKIVPSFSAFYPQQPPGLAAGHLGKGSYYRHDKREEHSKRYSFHVLLSVLEENVRLKGAVIFQYPLCRS
jgi:hypothetical protein